MIAANNSWCLAFDNLSNVPPWLSDAFCRLSTGGGFTTRELFTDQDEIIFDSQRPVMLTSIEEVATRSDLLDRSLIIWLCGIPEERRKSEAELFEAFQKVRPRILGALLDGIAVGLQRLPSTKLTNLPRMADFALWATASEKGFGWPNGSFMAAYQSNCASANEVALEASLIAQPLVELLEQNGEWEGPSGELLRALEDRASEQVRRRKGWPKSPGALSGQLKRLAPNLRKLGWNADRDRTSKKRSWVLRRQHEGNGTHDDGKGPASSSASSQQTWCDSMHLDANCCGPAGDDANDGNDAIFRTWNPDRY
jgi:hypothetical protein